MISRKNDILCSRFTDDVEPDTPAIGVLSLYFWVGYVVRERSDWNLRA